MPRDLRKPMPASARRGDTPGRGLPVTRRVGSERSQSIDSRSFFVAPPELAAHTFRVGADEFVVLSYPVEPVQPPAELTNAERHVVAALLSGKSNAAIAAERGTSPRTIANQVAAVFRKLGVRSRAELAARCARVPRG